MLMTEKEAKTKRCTPCASVAVLLYLSPEKWNEAVASDVVQTRCIGSACAQWCWYDYVDADGNTHFQPGNENQFLKGKARPSPITKSVAYPGRGYCGLTGARE